jgi:hypothetical protein
MMFKNPCFHWEMLHTYAHCKYIIYILCMYVLYTVTAPGDTYLRRQVKPGSRNLMVGPARAMGSTVDGIY